MRDIRPELTERLKGMTEKREQLAAQVKALEAEESALKTLIEIENRRFPSQQETLPLAATATSDEIKEFLGRVMGNGRPVALDRLLALAQAEGLVKGGRSLHAVLLNMKRAGQADIVSSGVWKLTKFDAPHAGSGGAS